MASGCGAGVVWLPPYSPTNVVEAEKDLRCAKVRTSEELDWGGGEELKLITESDCRSWFKHCGYQVT